MANYGLVKIRQQLHCKQIQLAAFFNISRQTLAYVEKESRDLSMDTIKEVHAIQQLLNARSEAGWTSPEIIKRVNEDKANAAHGLIDHLAHTRHLWQKSMMELDKMKMEFDTTVNALHNLNYLKLKSHVLGEAKIFWIEEQIKFLKENLSVVGPSSQQLLEIKIETLKAEIKHVNALLGNGFDILLESFAVLDKYNNLK